jgi:hypothetical protein
MITPRFIEQRIRNALKDTRVVMISGPRQSGKTTLAKMLIDSGTVYLTLDDETVVEAARFDPVGFIRGLDRAVIDEVQRAPQLLSAIKKSVDEDSRPGRFILTGSANILTIPTASESLAGRMEVMELHPFSRGEIIRCAPSFLGSVFQGNVPKPEEILIGDDLLGAVLGGGYPEALGKKDPTRRRQWYRSYVEAILKRDVREIANVHKLTEMPDLLKVLAHYSAQLLNTAEIGGKIGLDHKTVQRYIGIFEQIFLIRRLNAWHRNELKRLVKAPKLHLLDSGLMAAIQGLTQERLQKDRTLTGPLFETFVHSELIKQASWFESELSFHHYRDKDGYEVDIVLENDIGEIVGIEVKAAATVNKGDFRGLQKLRNAAGDNFRLGVVLHDGENVLPFGDGLFSAPFASLWS